MREGSHRAAVTLAIASVLLGAPVNASAQGSSLVEIGRAIIVVDATPSALAQINSALIGYRVLFTERALQEVPRLAEVPAIPARSADAPCLTSAVTLPGAPPLVNIANEIDAAALAAATQKTAFGSVVEQSIRLPDGTEASQVTARIQYQGWTYSIRTDPGMKTPLTVLAEPGEMQVVDGVAQIPGFREIPAEEFFAAMREGRPIDVNNPRYKRPKLVFYVSRIGGEDGVSLEIMHWARGYMRADGEVLIITGQRAASEELLELERMGARVEVIPEASPDLPVAQEEYEALYGPRDYRDTHGRGYWEDHGEAEMNAALDLVDERARIIRDKTEAILRQQDGYWVLDVENMGLGWKQNANAVAIGGVMEDMRPPVAGRIHDLPDDRPEYDWANVPTPIKERLNILRRDPNNVFGVINSFDEARMARRGLTGVRLIPNANDLLDPRLSIRPPKQDLDTWRRALLGEDADDTFIAMWPVRPVARKRGDVAIRMIQKALAQNPGRKIALVVSHSAQDASEAELETLRTMAADAGVDLVFAEEKLAEAGLEVDPLKLHHLSDVTVYPSDFEGWGNAANEAWQTGYATEGAERGAFGTIVVMNEYSVFTENIRPLGIETPTFKIPDSFKFSDSEARGLAVFDDPALAAFDADLDGAASTLNAVLDNRGTPGGLLSGSWAQMAAHNYDVLAASTDYPIITDIVVDMMWDAASAGNAGGPPR